MRNRRKLAAKNSIGKRMAQVSAVMIAATLAVLVAVPAAAAAGVLGVYNYFTRDLPDPSNVQNAREDFQTTRIFDRKGRLLMEVIDPTTGDRQWAPYDTISPFLVCATVANEDKTFFENQGFDARGIARAFITNLSTGSVQGGSSITQQVVKNVVLTSEERSKQSYERKIREVLVAQELTRRYSKNQVFEWYVNTNNYGSLAYGIEAAARIYFNKRAKDLTLAESAMLAAVPQSPVKNPFDTPIEAKDRQEKILEGIAQRLRDGLTIRGCNVTEEQVEAAKEEQLRLATRTQRFNLKSPHFSLYARDRAVELLSDHLGIDQQEAYNLVYRGGLAITTTLDLDIDDQVRLIANEQLLKLEQELRRKGKTSGWPNNASAVVMKPETGEILSMLGSRDYNNDVIDGKFNVALGQRQPGSSFKPLTFIELLRQGAEQKQPYSPGMGFWDVRITFPSGGAAPYVPENYDRKYHGPVLMRDALARSYNIPAVEAMAKAGIANTIRRAHLMGITDLRKGTDFYGLALTLGGGEVKLLDMVYAYSVIANGGSMRGQPRPANQIEAGYRRHDPAVILEIRDTNGKELFKYNLANPPETPRDRILGPFAEQITWQISSMLNDPQARAEAFGFPSELDLCLNRGCASPAGRRDASVKTGTTNDNKDNWTLGFTNDYVSGVWVGNTDNTAMDRDLTGLAGAAPIWNQVMTMLHKDLPNKPFKDPRSIGLVPIGVCAIDGLLPGSSDCPIRSAWAVPGTGPRETSNIVKKLRVLREGGQIAPADAPIESTEEKLFYIFPGIGRDWYDTLDERGKKSYPAPPSEPEAALTSVTNAELAFTFPANGGYVRSSQPLELRGSARGSNFLAYRVAYAKGFTTDPNAGWAGIGSDKTSPIENGVLETFDLGEARGRGWTQLTVRLTKVLTDNTASDAYLRFTIDDKPPAAKIQQPVQGSVFNGDEWVDVNVDATDDNTISKVEFFTAGATKPFITKTSSPFSVKWVVPPGFGGPVGFYVQAYDGAGNLVRSQQVSVSAYYKK